MHTFGNVNVRTGDILLKQGTGAATHKIIQLGQKLGRMSGGHSNIAHAAIYVGSVTGQSHAIAESVGGGLRFANPNPASSYNWHVWHLQGNEELRHFAADMASNIVAKAATDNGFGSYSKKGAAKSAFLSSNLAKRPVIGNVADTLLTDFTSPNGSCRSFFCSNFAVLAYAMAAHALGQPGSGIQLNYKFTSPAEMQKYFTRSHNWVHKGTISNAY